MRRDGGFTLIELMIAIALVAILLATAVPALDDFTNDARQTGAINDFISSIHIARNTAITTNSRVTMCASASGTNCELTSWDSGWIVFGDLNSNGSVDAGEAIVSASAAVEGLDILSGEFAVCDFRGAAHAKVILIELSGRPRMSETKANGAPATCI